VFARVNQVTFASLGYPLSVFNKKLYSHNPCHLIVVGPQADVVHPRLVSVVGFLLIHLIFWRYSERWELLKALLIVVDERELSSLCNCASVTKAHHQGNSDLQLLSQELD